MNFDEYNGFSIRRYHDVAEIYAFVDKETEGIPPGSEHLVFTPWLLGEREEGGNHQPAHHGRRTGCSILCLRGERDLFRVRRDQ